MTDEQGSSRQRSQASDAEIRRRVDALIADMTPAEKAGQLTQYFYFGFMKDADTASPAPGFGNQPAAVEAALGRGEAGSLLFVTDPAETNRLQRLTIDGNRLGIPALFGFDVIHGFRTIFPVPIAMAASWDLTLIEARPGSRGAGGAVGRYPLDVRADGGHRPRSPLGTHDRGRRRGSLPRRRCRRRAGPRIPGRRGRCCRPRDRRPEALRRVRCRSRRARLRRGRALRFRAVERLPPAVQGGRRRRRGQHHDRLHGPQRHSGHRQPRGSFSEVLRETWGFERLRRQRCPGRAQPRDPRLRRRPHRRRRPRPDRRRRHGDGGHRIPPTPTSRKPSKRATLATEVLDASVARVLEAKIRLGPLRGPVRRRGARP